MANEETTKTNAESTHDSTRDQTSAQERFEIPECCRQMMGSFCNPGERGEEHSAEHGSGSPGIFARLIIRMMNRCCGAFTEKHGVAEKV